MQLKLFINCLILLAQEFLLIINAKNIKGPPIIKEHPKSIVARKNYPVTLNCAVSGAHDISWFRDGQKVISNRQIAHSHRIVLQDGSLFFLRVTNNKRDGDAGVYWCVAINRWGKTRSRNATLSVAFLQEFLPREQSVAAVIGAKAVLSCRAPNGLPKPRVRWKHHNLVVEYDTRRYPNSDGDLIFDGVTRNDAGEYFCEASNLAGTEKSPRITLEIKDPYPRVSEKIKIANIEEDIILPCYSFGKSVTNVTWKKKGGKIPIDRSQIVRKHALQISRLEFSDSGKYYCESVGTTGTNIAAIVLKVYQKPEINHKFPNLLVTTGMNFNLSCNATGTPEPLLIWKLPLVDGSYKYIRTGQDNDAVYSTNSSQLVMKNARKHNNGRYICWGINSSSAVTASSIVAVMQTFPPPLMGSKPQDLGRREGYTATFPCEASSEFLPANITWWYRRNVTMKDVKVEPSTLISILPIGALVIRNVSSSDAGVYTCEVASEAGSVKEEALLIIDNVTIGLHPTRYVHRPAPPSKPIATSVTGSSIHLSWKPNSKGSRQEDVTYSISMWTSPWSKWESVVSGVSEETSHITGLRRNQLYLFVVKAINKYGSESFPSPWSNAISTSSGELVDLDEERDFRRRLSKVNVVLLKANTISTNTVDLSWEVDHDMGRQISTFAIYLIYGVVIDRYVVVRSPFGHRFTDVRPKSNVTIFVTPVLGSQEGIPSNSMSIEIGRTNDFQLSPRNIKATDFSSGFIITWEDPNPSGVQITGCEVLIMSNGTTTYYNTNETSIKFIPKSSSFSVKVAVVTGTGPGRWSELKSFPNTCCDESVPSVLRSPFHPAWFLYLLIPTGLIVILLSLLYLRYVHHKSAPPSVAQLASPVYYSDSSSFNQRERMNIYEDKRAWKPELESVQILKTSPVVAEYAEPRCRYDDPEPYATTALLAPPPTMSHYQRRNQVPEKDLGISWSTMLPPPPEESPPAENWNSSEVVGECDQCCNQDLHVYARPCNVESSSKIQYILPSSQFTRFASLQVPRREEVFILETKSSTH